MTEITVPMILEEFAEEGKQLSWAIVFIDPPALLSEDDKPIPPQVRNYILDLPDLYFLEWGELCRLASGFDCVIALELIGFKNKDQIISVGKNISKAPVNLEPFCDIMMDVDDGDFTELYVKDKVKGKEILDRIVKRFGPLPIGIYRPW